MASQANDKPQVFSQFYAKHGTPLQDSPRLRRRLGIWLKSFLSDYQERHVRNTINTGVGTNLSYDNLYDHFLKSSLPDALDSITHAFNGIKNTIPNGYSDDTKHSAEEWKNFTALALLEENVGYKLDAHCNVRFSVDEEFSRSESSTILMLALPRYEAARKSFESAMSALRYPDQTGTAIRNLFDANETVYKLMFAGKADKLATTNIETLLSPQVSYGLQDPELNSSKLMIKSFKEWISSAHFYRHAAGSEVPTPPSLDFAVWFFSCGAGHLRWLISLDQKLLARQTD
jgi:hypothetical protein